MRLFMPIQKTEELSDGTLLVTGIASTEAVDADGEIVKAAAIEKALPDFMRYGTGALREMHQQLAAGTVDKAEVSEGVTTVECTVVDPVAIKKVKTGTYKGFSIGGRVLARDPDDKKLVTGIKLIEVSLVDRPANPEAVLTMYKAETAEESPVSEDPKALRKARVAELASLLDKGGDELLVKLLDAAKAPAAPVAKAEDAAAIEAKDEQTPAAEAAAAPAGDPPAGEGQTPVADETATKAEKPSGEVLRKGLYHLCEFAKLIEQLGWLAASSQGELEWEQDGSPVPAQLRDWLSAGCGIFASMTAEECGELIAALKPKQAAAAAGDLAKGEQPAAAAPAADAAGAAPGPAAASPPDDLVKAELAKRDEQLAKALAAVEDLGSKLEKATARIEALEAQPAPGKALLKVLGKGEDVVTPEASQPAAVDPVKKVDGSTDDAATLIKSIHARGGIPVRFA